MITVACFGIKNLWIKVLDTRDRELLETGLNCTCLSQSQTLLLETLPCAELRLPHKEALPAQITGLQTPCCSQMFSSGVLAQFTAIGVIFQNSDPDLEAD